MRGVSAHHFYDWLVLFLVLESRDGLREDSVALDEENEEQDERDGLDDEEEQLREAERAEIRPFVRRVGARTDPATGEDGGVVEVEEASQQVEAEDAVFCELVQALYS